MGRVAALLRASGGPDPGRPPGCRREAATGQPTLDAAHPRDPCAGARRGIDDSPGQSAARVDLDHLDLLARRRGETGTPTRGGVFRSIATWDAPLDGAASESSAYIEMKRFFLFYITVRLMIADWPHLGMTPNPEFAEPPFPRTETLKPRPQTESRDSSQRSM
ncbi:hypothetical protein CO2235_150061 [Cupriavidus oxalaticus]|uniref:Uncharacterized protein n=1 Tax=Cupriavidus oxalaticus TaxID=96344 RepID=A0A375G310_9BURK|nr:hypothetical protein CO2235_U600057 [Cupriavidus oxalaticus]SPC12406.1 hypothetical protein CO2235_150061 [Cupriavidus oxalaticus]